ncbi:hypothetical protein OUZ56_014985 [Daphnia magna]|uniref:Uncharacterized protein n=1 Tax=Daphnia magna TaxID=35525 RepID=A0ABR0ALF2_9CRUS|nr:hypothetical protein OUZ56_014985 [Daphnia magna]
MAFISLAMRTGAAHRKWELILEVSKGLELTNPTSSDPIICHESIPYFLELEEESQDTKTDSKTPGIINQ